MKQELITDEETLVGAKSVLPIQVYDDGYGPLWVSTDSGGILGVIRCRRFEDAYEIAEEEFLPEASETVEELKKEYGENWFENELFQEQYGFRPNGPRNHERDPIGHGIYQKDLNGNWLWELTEELMSELGLELSIQKENGEVINRSFVHA